MDSDSWISSRRYLSRSDCKTIRDEMNELDIDIVADLYLDGHDDAEPGGADLRAEFLCPFCFEDYDVVSLCCHIDEEHPLQANAGVCPACGIRVGVDLVGHITTQHGNCFQVQRKRRIKKGVSNSTFNFRKELRDGALQSLLRGSSYAASSNSEPDPLLSSFISNHGVGDETASIQPSLSIEADLVQESSKDDFLERKPQQVQLSEEDQVEKARRFDFVQGLLFSTILDDKL